jgi:hypothetical protein
MLVLILASKNHIEHCEAIPLSKSEAQTSSCTPRKKYKKENPYVGEVKQYGVAV